jgi:hypothetical protein
MSQNPSSNDTGEAQYVASALVDLSHITSFNDATATDAASVQSEQSTHDPTYGGRYRPVPEITAGHNDRLKNLAASNQTASHTAAANGTHGSMVNGTGKYSTTPANADVQLGDIR